MREEYGFGVQHAAKKAVEIDAHQGGNKAAERPGANKGTVDHHMVDKIDHAKHAAHAKNAMGEMGHHNVEYYDGGLRK
jgi:hypothetical protein